MPANDAPASAGQAAPNATSTPSPTTPASAGSAVATTPAAVPVTWDAVKASIPKEYAAEKMWSSVKDIPGLLKNYAEAQKYIGGAVKLPKDGDGQDAYDAFYQKLGRPESAEGYEFQLPELPGGLEWQEPLINQFKKTAHAIGLTPKQAQYILNSYGEIVNGEVAGRREQLRAAHDALSKDIGPGYQKELAYGQAAIKQLGGEDVINAINVTGIGNHPGFIKMMIRIGRELGEDNIIDVQSMRETEQNAQAKIDEIYGNKKHPYFDTRNPGHKAAVQEVTRLFGLVHAGSLEDE